eukprot:TRINITY_DN27457_c0_g1_i1.p1 TRINITY_DN27457_c0_g1~~TRINITY_DN27457_c0_g1_i1.p1  ORF type:complete len:576 (-),score=94.25 TRINITY_DN27457_c0_g1_i1:61-1671(-)
MLHTTLAGHAGKQKIIRYDFAKLINVGPFLTLFAKGTVFNIDRTIFLNMTKYIIIFGIAMLNMILLDDESLSEFSEKSLPAFEVSTGNLQRFCPFLFGLFVSTMLGRWWALRTQGVGSVADHIVNVSCFLTANAARRLPRKSDWDLFRVEHNKVIRFGMASLSCLAWESRGGGRLEDLVKLGFVSESEKEHLENCSPHTRAEVLWCWMGCIASELMEMVKLPAPNLNMLFNDLNAGLDGVHAVHQYLGTQLPFPYVHMICLLVDIHNIVVAITSGLKFGAAYSQGLAFDCVIEALQLVIVPTMYQGLLQICMFLSDPMGDDFIDFPILEYQLQVQEACQSMVETTRKICEERWAEQRGPLPHASILKTLPPITSVYKDDGASSKGASQAKIVASSGKAEQESQLQLASMPLGNRNLSHLQFFEQLSGWLEGLQNNIAKIPPMPNMKGSATTQQRSLELTMTNTVQNQTVQESTTKTFTATQSSPAPFQQGGAFQKQEIAQQALVLPVVQKQSSQNGAPGLLMPCCEVTKAQTVQRH